MANSSLINDPIEAFEEFKVFPNPAQTGITVICPSSMNSQELVKIELADLLGKVIYTKFISKTGENYISVAELSNGVYILTATRNNTPLYKSKLIKQN